VRFRRPTELKIPRIDPDRRGFGKLVLFAQLGALKVGRFREGRYAWRNAL